MMPLALSLGWTPPVGSIIGLLIIGFGTLALMRALGMITRRYERFGRYTLVFGMLMAVLVFWAINRPAPRPLRIALVSFQPATPSARPEGLGAGVVHTAVDLLRLSLPPAIRVSALDDVDNAIRRERVTDRHSALQASMRLGAQYVVFGEYETNDLGVVLHIRIFNAADTTVATYDIVCDPDTLSAAPLRMVRALYSHIPAIAAIDSVLDLLPPSPPSEAFIQYCRGTAQFDTHTEQGYWAAIQAFQAATAIDSAYALPHWGLARVYNVWQRKGREFETDNAMMRRKAAASALKALELNPRLNEAYRLLAGVHISFKNWALAGNTLKKGIAADPREPLNYTLLATLNPERFQDFGVKDEAELCERATLLNPGAVSLWVTLTKACISAGKFIDGVTAGKQAVELGPTIPEAYAALGDAYIYTNQAFPARDAFTRALELDSKDQSLYQGLAKAYTLRQDRKNAIETYRRGIAALPDHADLCYDLGVLYQRMGRWEEGVPWFERAIEVGNHANAHFYMARWYEKQGNREKAIAHWRARILAGDPDDEWTKDAVRRLNLLSPNALRAIEVGR